MKTVRVSKAMLVKLCEAVIDSSIYWSGKDEEKESKLKTARTLAGSFLNDIQLEKE